MTDDQYLKSEFDFKVIVDAIDELQDGIVLFDRDDRILYCNARHKALFPDVVDLLVPGTSFETLIRAGVKRNIIADAVGREEEWIQERLAAHRSEKESTFQQLTADGTCVEIREKELANGYRIGFRTDITERKRVEMALQKSIEDVNNANQAKTDFLSAMSHELRTPLHAILGFANLLGADKENPLSEEQASLLDYITKGGAHLLKLISETLDLAKIESGKLAINPDIVGANTIIDECLALSETLATQREIIVDNRSGTHLPAIWVDRLRATQALLNLLSNAIKYSPVGGEVWLETTSPTDGFLRMSVVDKGKGIDKDRQEELFRPFNRLGAEITETEGSGIGLTLSKKIVEEMGGIIGFESTAGVGSTFWIEFPISTEALMTSAVEPAPTEPVAPGRPDEDQQLLYVEDNPANLALMEKIISKLPNLSMMSTRTAEEGLEMAARYKPDVIILDINLPGMDGFEAVERLLASDETADIPVMALSADAMPESIERGYQAGFSRYLTKPLNVPALLSALKEALEPEEAEQDT